MAAKVFEVNDVLPATTQLRISWTITATNVPNFPYVDGYFRIFCLSDDALIRIHVDDDISKPFSININSIPVKTYSSWISPYTDADGNHAYIDIDTSNWSVSERTISLIEHTSINDFFYWEDLNASSGYTITFETNGGSSISSINDATELPTTLPTPTKSGYTFVAWYYESNFQTRAKAGDTIESNVTLYAKWHNLGSLFTEIANAIRSKDGTSGNIRDLDFDDRIRAIEPAKEEETKTVTPDFSSGNVDVTPTSGKVMTKVTINKDSNLIADNIKSGVTIFGITGTLE